MLTQPAARNTDSRLGNLLDGICLSPAWEVALRAALGRLARTVSDSDLAILQIFRRYRQLGGDRSRISLTIPSGAATEYPVCVAVLAWAQHNPGPAITSLTAVLVATACGTEGRDPEQRKSIVALAGMVHRAIMHASAPLTILLADAHDLPSLMQRVDAAIEADSKLHQTFVALWTRWLRHRIARWIMSRPDRLRRAFLSPSEIQPDIAAPVLPIWGEATADDDDVLDVESAYVGGNAYETLRPRAVHGLATAHALLRRSGDAGLSMRAGYIVPDALIARLAQTSIRAAQTASTSRQAERYTALAFAIATGLRESDIAQVIWGPCAPEVDGNHRIAIDADRPVLTLQVLRPAHAANPSPDLAAFFGSPDSGYNAHTMHWPLPPSLHGLLMALSVGAPSPGAPAFPENGNAYRLRDVISELDPGSFIGAGRIRLALASQLAERYGPEAAQLAMRDSCATSLGPAYYGVFAEREVMGTVGKITSRWFDEAVPSTANTQACIGSRIVLSAEAAQKWPQSLAKAKYSVARQKVPVAEQLRAERNHLVAALCAVTGMRPEHRIGDLTLDSFIPDYALVVLEDKQVDVLRRTRVAATGRRWVAALRDYLDRLVELSGCDDATVNHWAATVLRAELPLFSLPAAHGVERLDIDMVVKSMPAPLHAQRNHYRHRLNQYLQRQGVDWELRHAQMGWVVSPAYAMADLSPLSAVAMGDQLAGVIDQLTIDDGWYTQRQRTPRWTWRGVPGRPLPDWDQRICEHEAEEAVYARGIREEYVRRRKEIEADLLPRVAISIAEMLPELRADIEHRTLVPVLRSQSVNPVQLTMEHYALVRDRVRQGDRDGTSVLRALATEHLIHELVKRARRTGVVLGPDPPRRQLSIKAQPSPFVRGIGLAVRHAEAIRERLAQIAADGRAHDQRGLVQLSIMARSPYRKYDFAAAALRAAAQGMRSTSARDRLYIPVPADRGDHPLVFAGIEAATLARRARDAPTARPLDAVQLAQWIRERMHDLASGEIDDGQLVARLIGTLRAAGRIELSGPERLVMYSTPLAVVGTRRSVGVADNWPLQTGGANASDDQRPEQIMEEDASERVTQERGVKAGYRRLTRLLCPNATRGGSAEESDGKRGWRGKLDRVLTALIEDLGASTNVGLIAQYTHHRVRYGGRRKSNLSRRTLYKELTRFGAALLDILGKRSMLLLDADDLQAVYLAVLCAKSRSVRADVLEELEKYHAYLGAAHQIPDVDFASLRSYAGPRVRTSDAGALSDREVERVYAELLLDLERETDRSDSSPADVRACGLRVLMYVILEASGVRPSSAYGLVLSDLHLLGAGDDCLHVHATGNYGEAKTVTSVGFVRLDGPLWQRDRDRVLAWLEREKSALGAEYWQYPIFGDAIGSRRRFALAYMTRRIDALLRWVTDDDRAHTYWLRKRRVTARIGEAMAAPGTTARAVYRALRESGHAGIVTPLMHYIHDPQVAVASYLTRASMPDRALTLHATALPAGPLDAIWHRTRMNGDRCTYAPVLDQLGACIATSPAEALTPPPIMRRQAHLTARHIDIYARAVQRDESKHLACIRAGLSDMQVVRLDRACRDMLVSRGAAPWYVDGSQHARTVLVRPPRRVPGSDQLFTLLDKQPSSWLEVIVDLWATQARIDRIHAKDIVLVLKDEQSRAAVGQLLLATGANMRAHTTDAGVCVLVDDSPRRRGNGALAGVLQWVFAMHWLLRHATDSSGSSS